MNIIRSLIVTVAEIGETVSSVLDCITVTTFGLTLFAIARSAA